MGRNSPSASASPTFVLRRWRLLAWAAGLSLLFGGLMVSVAFDQGLRITRNAIAPLRASGDIVVVGIDETSLTKVGEWPWKRSTLAEMIDRARELGARRTYLDIVLDAKSTDVEDQILARSLARNGNVVLPLRDGIGVNDRTQRNFFGQPLPLFRAHAQLASISVNYDYRHAVWRLAYENQNQLSFAASLAGITRPSVKSGTDFPILYAIDPMTVPVISAHDLLDGRVDPRAVRGKQLVIAATADQVNDQFWLPGVGRMAGVYVQVLGAETLKLGSPVDLGWLGLLLLTLVLLAATLSPRVSSSRGPVMATFGAALLIAPLPMEQHLIFVDVAPALLALGVVAAQMAWLRWRSRGLVDAVSGLPNLAALRSDRATHDHVLITTRIQNYAAITSTIGQVEEQELIRQIVDRLRVTNAEHRVFQGDEGIFAWFVEPGAAIGNHLEALHSLFRSPLTVGGRAIDLAVSFGAELGSARPLANRLGSALVAADEAWSEGLKWKYHDPSRLEEVKWRLSLLGELDAAIDNGEVWLAYQPQLDLQHGGIIGAEALARWTHPTKGPIGPAEFVAAAEANGRIGKLTDFVLDRAIATAAAINRRGIPFTVAVNLSARLLSDPSWLDRVQTLLRGHGLAPERLTLELTESAALDDGDSGMALLDALRGIGVRIALDDYGTGLSTLEYLKKVPAHEIKLDQSFIKAMRVNRGDLLMVQSTIALAHSLNRTVVAEGVEDMASLDDLRAMGCDVAQGFVISRPLGVRELVQSLQARTRTRTQKVA